jgi:hypothetical protein
VTASDALTVAPRPAAAPGGAGQIAGGAGTAHDRHSQARDGRRHDERVLAGGRERLRRGARLRTGGRSASATARVSTIRARPIGRDRGVEVVVI